MAAANVDEPTTMHGVVHGYTVFTHSTNIRQRPFFSQSSLASPTVSIQNSWKAQNTEKWA